jgi:hypothetical protein
LKRLSKVPQIEAGSTEMITAIVTAGMGLIDALTALANLCKDGVMAMDRVRVKQILDALREIYFYDDRTLSLLEKTIEGEELSFDEVDRALGGLFRGEDKISEALQKLDQAELSPHNDLSVEAWNKLRGLSGGKWDVRFAIRHFLYDLATPPADGGEKASRIEQAMQIRAQILEINARIKVIDDSLRGR